MDQLKRQLLTSLRDKTLDRKGFRKNSAKLNHLLALEAAARLPATAIEVQTPIASTQGLRQAGGVLLVPILRSGLPMLQVFLDHFEDAAVGILGFFRNPETKQPKCYYSNIPLPGPQDTVLILDPMIATGGTACAAIDKLKDMGIAESRIIFVSLLASREGYDHVREQHPAVAIVIGEIDEKLNDAKYIVPGLGDYGDRYFGTEHC